MFNPKVSIIIPVYNGANYMREAVDSAIAQTYKNIEIIVVNDGSNDNGETDKIARSYGDKIKYIVKENGGSSSALNIGIRNMTGDYFSWLSHDDVYEKERIEKMVEKINEKNYDMQCIVCGSRLINENSEIIPYFKAQLNGIMDSAKMFRMLQKGLRINGCCILIPKCVIEKVGYFDEKLRYVNDTDYWYRLMIFGCEFVCFNEPLVSTRIHGKQVSVTHSHIFVNESKCLANKVFESLSKNGFDNCKIVKSYIKKASIDGNIEVVKTYLPQILKEKSFVVKIGYLFVMYCYYLYGKNISFLKRIYKKIFFKR